MLSQNYVAFDSVQLLFAASESFAQHLVVHLFKPADELTTFNKCFGSLLAFNEQTSITHTVPLSWPNPSCQFRFFMVYSVSIRAVLKQHTFTILYSRRSGEGINGTFERSCRLFEETVVKLVMRLPSNIAIDLYCRNK